MKNRKSGFYLSPLWILSALMIFSAFGVTAPNTGTVDATRTTGTATSAGEPGTAGTKPTAPFGPFSPDTTNYSQSARVPSPRASATTGITPFASPSPR